MLNRRVCAPQQIANLWPHCCLVASLQIGSTAISLFGFNGYAGPRYKFTNCQFCQQSTGAPVMFWPSQAVPIALTEAEWAGSVLGCT